MSYGFEARNQNNIMQIDGEHGNMAVYASGTLNASYVPPSNVAVNYAQAYPSSLPSDYLIFAKPNSMSTGSDVPFSLIENSTSFGFVLPYGSTSTISIDWVICVSHGDMNLPTSPDFGLQVYNSGGSVVFSSNFENFRCNQVSFDDATSSSYTPNVFSGADCSEDYSLLSGHSEIGRIPVNGAFGLVQSLFVIYKAGTSQITNTVLNSRPAAPGGGAFGGGRVTNMIGQFE